ncbi:MAG: GNAT family N-acetyltransferase [bacterium]
MFLQEDDVRIVSTVADDPDLVHLSQDYGVLQNLSETRLYSEPMPTSMVFRIEYEDHLVGEISLKTIKWFNRKAEVSIFIAKEYQGKGLAKKAMFALMRFAFKTMNLNRLEAEVVDYNERVKSLIEELGFTFEGRLRKAKYFDGRYYDILRYGILSPEYFEKNSEEAK